MNEKSNISPVRRPKLKGSVKFINNEKNLFFPTLKIRVDDYFVEGRLSKFGNVRMKVKSVVLLALYFLPFVAILIWPVPAGISLVLWTLMGLGISGLGMSVMHDANHGSYSENVFVNNMMAHVLNLLGGSTLNWKFQHNILHHTYTNIANMDDDIDNKLALRFCEHTQAKSVHRFQWWYAFLLYGLTSLYWVTAKDFVQFVKFKKNKVNAHSPKENRVILLKIFVVKLVYLFVFLVMPTLIFDVPFLQAITGFLLMHFVAGVILTVIFQLAHSLEGTSHPLPNDKGIIENDWAIHQMNTTVNFSRNNKWLSWYVGGLNFQVEHHLFPRISHVHYPKISSIVKSTALEFNIPYLENKTFLEAFRSHVLFLKKLGRMPSLGEAIG